jgi:glutamine---fructose-6-phosphate transaminase (isomerizing)
VSRLAHEIAEQPAAIDQLLGRQLPELDALRSRLWPDDIRYVVIVARGSSDNAARYAQYLFGLQHRLPVALATPSVTSIYDVELQLDGALVIGISQSGQSPDVVGTLAAAKAQGRPALAITNDPDSPLAEAATDVLDLGVGSEQAVAATKTYTSSLVALALVSAARTTGSQRRQLLTELESLPELIDDALRISTTEAAELLASRPHLLVAGRGLNYSTAFEAALKIRELSGMIAEAFSPPDLLHGPIAAVAAPAAALLVAPDEPSTVSHHELVHRLRELDTPVIAVSADPELVQLADLTIGLGRQPAGWLTPVTTIVPLQRLAAGMAGLRDRDPDAPVGLTKVTRTH